MTAALIYVQLTLAFLMALPAGHTYARDNGQWSQADPQRRQWFQQQIVPRGDHKGFSCCSTADGSEAVEDIRDGHYWASWPGSNGWHEVPDDAVIYDSRPPRAPVVWWFIDNSGEFAIRCFVPGAGL